MSPALVIWSHGQESGPYGTKFSALAELARSRNFVVEALDYRGLSDPDQRVSKLIEYGMSRSRPLILAGSSLGGYVSVAAAVRLKPRGLFLLAPALYIPELTSQEYKITTCPITLVHGWRDEIIPPENSVRFARTHKATLHIIDDDHRLKGDLPALCLFFSHFLDNIC